jgi:hypothetical protein
MALLSCYRRVHCIYNREKLNIYVNQRKKWYIFALDKIFTFFPWVEKSIKKGNFITFRCFCFR